MNIITEFPRAWELEASFDLNKQYDGEDNSEMEDADVMSHSTISISTFGLSFLQLAAVASRPEIRRDASTRPV